MDRPFLSILIPTKNRSHYLSYAIQSALALPSNDLEIIVSENFGSDDGLAVARSFTDPRLKVIQPPRPMAMHDHWEFLLSNSSGEWITIIGDDDAILPNALDNVRTIFANYPFVEAIYSARSYFFWPLELGLSGRVQFSVSKELKIDDSKDCLNKLLKGQLLYCYAPQIYSGGFLRRTLIRRVINSRGRFFYSTIPDATSALNALLFTTSFVRTGIPLTIVGTSPSKAQSTNTRLAKDRDADFFGSLGESGVDLHPAVDGFRNHTFSMCFLDTYLTASPLINLRDVDREFITPLIYRSIIDYQKAGRIDLAALLAASSGVAFPDNLALDNYQRLFPEEVPDPISGSTVYSSKPDGMIETISQAVALISSVISSA